MPFRVFRVSSILVSGRGNISSEESSSFGILMVNSLSLMCGKNSLNRFFFIYIYFGWDLYIFRVKFRLFCPEGNSHYFAAEWWFIRVNGGALSNIGHQQGNSYMGRHLIKYVLLNLFRYTMSNKSVFRQYNLFNNSIAFCYICPLQS